MINREAETQAEGEAGSRQGARRGTPFRVSRIAPWAEGGAKPLSHQGCPPFIYFYLLSFKDFIYLFMREREREREREAQAEREAGSTPGARCGTRSRDSRIAPWAKGRSGTTEPPRDPLIRDF